MKPALSIAAALGLALLASPALAGPVRADAEACAAEKARADAAHANTIGPECTRLLAAYGSSGAPQWVKDADAEGLRDLALTLSEPRPQANTALPDPAAVPALLARLREATAEQHLGLWQRIWRWLQEMRNQPEDLPAPPWARKLIDWLSHVPPSAANVTFWSLFALLAALLATLIIIELRASQRFQRRANAAGSSSTKRSATVVTPMLSLDEIARLPALARPAALLRWLLRNLARRGLLPPDEALTHRELASRLPAAEADAFKRFIRDIEPSVYGGVTLGDSEFAAVRSLAVNLAADATEKPR